MARDQQPIEKPERDCRHHKQIHRREAVGMIAEERLGDLRRTSSPGHILGNAGLADLNTKLEKLSMDSRRSPKQVGDAHLADQVGELPAIQPVGHNVVAIYSANTLESPRGANGR